MAFALKHGSAPKKCSKGPAGGHKQRGQRGAMSGVVQHTGRTGTQLCPLQADIHTHTHMLTQTKAHTACSTGFASSHLVVIEPPQDNVYEI